MRPRLKEMPCPGRAFRGSCCFRWWLQLMSSRNPCRSRKFRTMPFIPKLAGRPAARTTVSSSLDLVEVGGIESVTSAFRARTDRVKVGARVMRLDVSYQVHPPVCPILNALPRPRSVRGERPDEPAVRSQRERVGIAVLKMLRVLFGQRNVYLPIAVLDVAARVERTVPPFATHNT